MKHYNNLICNASHNSFCERIHILYRSFQISLWFFLPLLFLEEQALCNTTQNIFPWNRKTRNSEIWFTTPWAQDVIIYIIIYISYMYERPGRSLNILCTFNLRPVPRVWSNSFACCNFVHYLSRKVFCNILFQKFLNYTPGTGGLAPYMSLFQNKYWCRIFIYK